jgi:hypothetical protein
VLLTNTFDLFDLLRNKSKWKAMIIEISLLVTLITINLQASAFAFPPDCDRTGYPSCYNIGFGGGQASPRTHCPSGHSRAFCNGWNVGASANPDSNNRIQNVQQNSSLSSSNQSTTFIFVILFLLIIGIISFKCFVA